MTGKRESKTRLEEKNEKEMRENEIYFEGKMKFGSDSHKRRIGKHFVFISLVSLKSE